MGFHSLCTPGVIKMRYYPYVPPTIPAGEDEHRVILRLVVDFLERFGQELEHFQYDDLPEQLQGRTFDGFLGPLPLWTRLKFDFQTAYCTLRAMLDGDITVEDEPNDPPNTPGDSVIPAPVAAGDEG